MKTGHIVSADPQPAHDNNVLYLHYNETQQGDYRFWMDAEAEAITESISGAGTSQYDFNFSLRPVLDKPLAPDLEAEDNVIVTLHLDAWDPFDSAPIKNLSIDFVYGDHTIHSDAPDNMPPGNITFELKINLDMISARTPIYLRVHFEIILVSSFTFYTDSTSRVTLVLLEDTDHDGIPDSIDLDDDNDGWTDEAEIEAGTDPKVPGWNITLPQEDDNTLSPFLLLPALVGYVIMIIIVVIIIYRVMKKRK